MSLSNSLTAILEADMPAAFEMFARRLDAHWVDEALEETGTASVRRRRIPAPLVVWLVIGMAMFRDRSIQEVVSHLDLALPSEKAKGASVSKSVAPSAIPQARYRMGASPLKVIFERTAEAWAEKAAGDDRWRGLGLYGADGVTFRIPDTDENREAFGLPGSSRGQAGYPQVRLVALMALRSHLISAAAFGPCSGKKTGEISLAQQLWCQLPEDSLVVLDRGFLSYGLLYHLNHDEDGIVNERKHWLTRSKKNLRWKTLRVFSEGDELVELKLSSQARRRDPTLPKTMVVRAIRYQVKGFQPQTLLTSLIDPEQYPPKEVAALYHERWEIELGYDEVKTHMLERQEALRSRKAEGVRQEVYGILLAYNLVRAEMLDVAEAAGVHPLRISFRHSLMLIRVFCTVDAWTCAPGNLPRRIADHRAVLAALLVLPERRPERRYKRHVKIKMSSYKRNPGRQIGKAGK